MVETACMYQINWDTPEKRPLNGSYFAVVCLSMRLMLPLRVLSRSGFMSAAACDECSLDVTLGDVLFDSLQ